MILKTYYKNIQRVRLGLSIVHNLSAWMQVLSYFGSLAIGVSALTGCGTVDLNARMYDSRDFYFVTQSNQRQHDPDAYFKHEYRYLNLRGAAGESSTRPRSLRGLALSGGGIRSAAFQLGMLSGLHSGLDDGHTLLSSIDYISSVSGGSWANGSYWSTRQRDDQFFSCLVSYASDGSPKSGCMPPAQKLCNSQNILAVPIKKGRLQQRKVEWENDIKVAYLPDCNINFGQPDQFKSCVKSGNLRPYPIFNSTHSASDERAKPTHYPFESTPHYQGTNIDDSEFKGFPDYLYV